MSDPHVYDCADWYVPGEHMPADFKRIHAMVPTGFFIQWALENGLASERFRTGAAEVIRATLARKATPLHLYAACRGVFDETMLNERGNAFAAKYFDIETGIYLYDFAELFIDYEHHFLVEPTWENYEAVAPLISQRLAEWTRLFG